MGAAAALVGVSTLAIGGSATATDFYVLDSDFGVEGTSYPPGWFKGNVTSPGTMESTVSGLSLTGPFQILNGTTPTTGLVSLVDGAELGVVSGEIAFQIPIFARGTANTDYTTLVPVDPGNAGLHRVGGWQTTNDVFADDGTTILLDDAAFYTMQEIEDALNTLTDKYEILAFGAYLPLTKSAVVSHITWAGNIHWFLPAPTATITPASLTVDQMDKTGVSGVFTGFVPGETVTAGFGNGQSGGPLPGSYTADVNGSVTVTHSDASLAPGTYTLSTFGEDSGVAVWGSFAVVANQLAATGAEVTPFVVAGSVLLLAGAGLGAVAIRRRATAARSM